MHVSLLPRLVVGLACAGIPAAASRDVLVSRRFWKRDDLSSRTNMSFFHVNDVHAHLDAYAPSGTECTDATNTCYGGMARLKAAVDSRRGSARPSLWLDAGDEFQGTMYWTYYKSAKISQAVDVLGFDAMTLGNHEFDAGDDELARFAGNITFPVISANVVSDHPGLNATIVPYKVFADLGVAVVGATTTTTPSISNPGRGTRFLDVAASVQRAVDEIRATTDVTRIVALTHIGYEDDVRLAEETSGLGLIMGGHSHTLLGPVDGAEGPYPTIATNRDGREVFVVTAYRWGEYLGYIDVTFAEDGSALAYVGGPIRMDPAQPVDRAFEARIEEWARPFREFAAEVVGEAGVDLDQTACRRGDCLLGQFMADAMLRYRLNQTSDDADPEGVPHFALVNAGGIRAGIPSGPVTRGEVLTAFPFGNAVAQLAYGGSELRRILRGCVAGRSDFDGEKVIGWFQVSEGIAIEYDPDAPAGSELVSVRIGGVPLEDDERYNMVTLDFVAGGGDNILPPRSDYVSLDTQDEVLTWYIRDQSPVEVAVEPRVVPVSKPRGPGDDVGASASMRASNLAVVVVATVGLWYGLLP